MPSKPLRSAAPKVPAELADVALVDGPTAAAAAAMSLSKFSDLVRVGLAPQPVIRGQRFTRWLLADVRAWLIQLPSQSIFDTSEIGVVEKATNASRVAQKRRLERAAQRCGS